MKASPASTGVPPVVSVKFDPETVEAFIVFENVAVTETDVPTLRSPFAGLVAMTLGAVVSTVTG
jgi:hypothetical protein